MNNFKRILCTCLLAMGVLNLSASEQGMTKQTIKNPFPINPKTFTPLLAAGGAYSTDFGQFGPMSTYDTKQFWLTEWDSPEQEISWNITTPKSGEYKVVLMIDSPKGEKITVSSDASTFTYTTVNEGWQRTTPDNTITLAKGENKVSVKLAATPKKPLIIKSIELFAANEEAAIEKRIQASKGDASWMKDSGYGIMTQVGGWAYPEKGDKKPWPGFAEDFDAKAFVEKIDKMGAKFLVWSGTWISYHFPAPIKAIAEVLPDRVSERDLIGDLIDECKKRDIKFMLYYHCGHGQEEILNAMGLHKDWITSGQRDKDAWLDRQMKILKEIGLRYKDGLDAVFLDDACTWYPANLEEVSKAAKAGNSKRLLCINPWIAAQHTPFQDFFCGEGFSGTKTPWGVKDGVFTDGPQEGMQGWGCFVFDGPNWGVHEANTVANSPKGWTVESLVNLTKKLEQERYSIGINVLVYEDGTIPAESYNLLEKTAKELKRGAWEE